MDLSTIDTLFFLWFGAILYTTAFLFALGNLISDRPYLRSLFYSLLTSGFIFQGLALYSRGIQLSTFPVTTPLEILQIISWSLVLLVLIVQMLFQLKLLGFFGSALASIISVVSLIVPAFNQAYDTSNMLNNPWIEFHAVLAIFAYGAFGILAIVSLMYILQDYGLTQKHYGGLFALLPSLQQLNDISHKLLIIGFTALSLGVAMGTLSWLSHFGDVFMGKILSVWGLWFCYLSVLLLKSKKQWHPRFSSWACLALFLFAILSLWFLKGNTLSV